MHMADALVSPTVAGTLYACSTVAAAYSVKKVREVNDLKKVPMMGVMGAFVFATQMINFTIPGTGSSGHLCGGMLVSALLGPFAGFLTMIGVLLVQGLMFADGGLLAFGCNVWNMAFYGCFVGALLIWKPLMKGGASKKKIIAASIFGSAVTLQLGACSVTLETLASGITELPFQVFLAAMQPIHLAIGLVEGLITAAVLVFVYEARPELLYIAEEQTEKTGRFTFKKTMAILMLLGLLIGGGFSLLASSDPDGLEWSIAKVSGKEELEAEGAIYEMAAKAQEKTALLPDYSFKHTEGSAGTSFSGIIGTLLVVALCAGASHVFKFFRKKDHVQST